MLTFVYVKFKPAQKNACAQPLTNELGWPVSFEPAKWKAIIHGRVRHREFEQDPGISDLRQTLKYCEPAGSDYPCSLNLMIEMDDPRHEFPAIKTLLMKHFLGCEEIGIASDAMILDQKPEGKLLAFERKAA